MSTRGERPERLLTVAEAAGLTSYGESVIHDWMARGLPFVAGAGRTRPRRKDIRIRESALWAWVAGLEIERRPKADAPAKAAARRGAAATPSGGLSAWRKAKGAT